MMSRIAPLTLGTLFVVGCVDAWFISTLIGSTTADEQIVTKATKPFLKLQSSDQAPHPAKPIGDYSAILAQPIFFKTRAPYVAALPAPPPARPPAPAVPAPVITDPGLVLGGVVMNRELRKVYIFSKGESQGTWINEGESFKGWKLETVDSKGAKLQQQNRTIELFLFPPQ
jgi:hypothetical protein